MNDKGHLIANEQLSRAKAFVLYSLSQEGVIEYSSITGENKCEWLGLMTYAERDISNNIDRNIEMDVEEL